LAPPLGDDGEVLFVYGTLMPGHLRWPLLEPFVVDHHRASVVGRLFDTGHGYPAARFGTGEPIEGVVVRFHEGRVEEAWTTLDAVEGDGYDRVAVTTVTGWAVQSYSWRDPVEGLRPLGPRWTGA
jgi:gamma-glutamylcyclotransferase (GGCT)/AIG2-like uncharacterized protein YtfP